MSPTSIGDLAANFMNRRFDARVNDRIQTLSLELTTGVTEDPVERLGGMTAGLVALDRSLSLMDAYDLAGKQAVNVATATRITLQGVGGHLGAIEGSTAIFLEGGSDAAVGPLAQESRSAFDGVIETLNTQLLGKPLFAGTSVSGPAIQSSDQIFSNLTASLTGLTTAEDVSDAIDDYFRPGGAFEAADYLGADRSRDAMRVGAGRTVSLDLRADDDRLRGTLAELAKIAVLDMGVLAGEEKERVALVSGRMSDLLSARDALTDMTAEAGSAEASLEQIATRNATERESLSKHRLNLLATDPYATATELQSSEAQLEMLYTLTARLSRLSLTAYL